MTPLIHRRLSFVLCPFVCFESSSSSLVKVDILSCSSLLAWYGAVSHRCFYCFSQLFFKNVLMDLRDCMSWRLGDAALLRPCVWSGRKHAATTVLASHHGNASGQMLCMNISALTDLCLLVPHCRSLHGGNLVALCLQKPGALADHVVSCRQQALGGISCEAEAAAHATSTRPEVACFFEPVRLF